MQRPPEITGNMNGRAPGSKALVMSEFEPYEATRTSRDHPRLSARRFCASVTSRRLFSRASFPDRGTAGRLGRVPPESPRSLSILKRTPCVWKACDPRDDGDCHRYRSTCGRGSTGWRCSSCRATRCFEQSGDGGVAWLSSPRSGAYDAGQGGHGLMSAGCHVVRQWLDVEPF